MKDINIAIDGYAGCGKSSTAKRVATALNYLYIDSGAMYRAVTLYFLEHGIDFQQENEQMLEALENIYIDFTQPLGAPYPRIRLNGRIVEEEIRQPAVSEAVSLVSVHAAVRRELVRQQQRMGEDKGVVMDGRDIGTVVFPDAELKIFMTASLEVRARRRQLEEQSRGIYQPLSKIIENLKKRDEIDTGREIGPLRQAPDAVVIDTTNMELEQQVELVLKLAYERMRA
ncbi:MAG: (d)CMP kinase [Bacteroidetes bacterium]|nr:MAG: (d)CMP kinase [Bacteroidota bacterium]